MLKKWMFTFVLLLVLPLNVFAQDIPERPTTAGFVFDYQNVIDDSVEAEINEIARRLQEEGKMELMIVTVPTIGELEPYEYGMKFFREWGIGDAEKDNGMLIYITTDMGEGNNVVRISTGYGMEGSYPDSETQRLIQTYMKESLKSGDYTSAFANVVEAIRVKEDIDYTWENDGAVIEEMSENTEESEETLFEKITGIFFTIIGILFFLIMAGVALLIAYVVLEGIFRRLQGLFYWIFKAIFRKDIRSKGYIKYLENKKQEQKKNKARKPSGLYYDNHYDSSNSSDSYSYGSGDSGGGGSDDRF